jgi:hypothetical protein
MRIIAIFIFLSNAILLQAQIKFGLHWQAMTGSNSGAAIADSITIEERSYTERSLNLPSPFFEYRHIAKTPLTVSTSFNLSTNGDIGLGAIVYNNLNVGKPFAIQYPLFYSISTLIDIPFSIGYSIIQPGNLLIRNLPLEIELFGGLDLKLKSRPFLPNDNLTSRNEAGVNEVYRSLPTTIKITNYYYSYGVRVKYGRFFISYRKDLQIAKTGTNSIVVFNKEYPFVTNWEYSYLAVGYYFGWFDRKSKK